MNKFYSIATDKYVPLSYDNAYLFNQYDRISNFLAFNVDKKYKNILGKPVKTNYQIDWYSPFSNLQQLEQSNFRPQGLQQYWQLYEELQEVLQQMLQRQDSNLHNWIAIIQDVFNPENNLIFTNGKDISIIWGWKFENNQNQKPNILTNDFSAVEEVQAPKAEKPPVILPPPIMPQVEKPAEDKDGNVKIDIYVDPIDPLLEDRLKETDSAAVAHSQKRGFLGFLKYFAARYWWILVVLLVLICLVFFVKSLSLN